MVYNNVSNEYYLEGWYSKNGKGHIPCIFKKLEFNYKNICVEKINGLKGIYSYKGEEIIPPKFNTIIDIGKFIAGLIGEDQLEIYDVEGKCLYNTDK